MYLKCTIGDFGIAGILKNQRGCGIGSWLISTVGGRIHLPLVILKEVYSNGHSYFGAPKSGMNTFLMTNINAQTGIL